MLETRVLHGRMRSVLSSSTLRMMSILFFVPTCSTLAGICMGECNKGDFLSTHSNRDFFSKLAISHERRQQSIHGGHSGDALRPRHIEGGLDVHASRAHCGSCHAVVLHHWSLMPSIPRDFFQLSDSFCLSRRRVRLWLNFCQFRLLAILTSAKLAEVELVEVEHLQE